MTPRAVDPATTAVLALVDDDRVAAAVPLMARDAQRFVDQVSRWVLDRG